MNQIFSDLFSPKAKIIPLQLLMEEKFPLQNFFEMLSQTISSFLTRWSWTFS